MKFEIKKIDEDDRLLRHSTKDATPVVEALEKLNDFEYFDVPRDFLCLGTLAKIVKKYKKDNKIDSKFKLAYLDKDLNSLKTKDYKYYSVIRVIKHK